MLARTSATLGHPLASDELLALGATDALRRQLDAILAEIETGTRAAFQQGWFSDEPAASPRWWQRTAGLLRASEAWVLPREVETVGALRVPAIRAWAVAPALAVENDDLLLVTAEAQAGVRLLYEPEYEKYHQAGPWHLTIWGGDWIRAAESANV